MLTVGEVHTGLLQNWASLTQLLSTQVLVLVPGARVRRSERPIAHVVSPDLLTGIDCRLATSSGARVRGIGTAVSRATITGGRILQGCAYAQITKSGADRRLSWSHYLSRPGVVETLGKTDRARPRWWLSHGQAGTAVSLDLGAISGRVMDMVQRCRYRAIVKTCGWKILIRPLDVDVRGPLAWGADLARTSNLEHRAGAHAADARGVHRVAGAGRAADCPDRMSAIRPPRSAPAGSMAR